MSTSIKPETSAIAAIAELPVLPLRDVVVYPHMVIPLFVGREKSMKALDITMAGDKRILLVAQRGADIERCYRVVAKRPAVRRVHRHCRQQASFQRADTDVDRLSREAADGGAAHEAP